MISRMMLITALVVAVSGCVVPTEEPIGAAAQADSALTPDDFTLEPGPPERARPTMPTRATLPLTVGAMLLAEIAACRGGTSPAIAMMCMAAVLQSQ